MRYNGYFFRINADRDRIKQEIKKYTPLTSKQTHFDITNKKMEDSDEIFIVHGHNDAIKEKVARFIEKLKLRPVILHEKPNAGRTIIEKFEDHSKVGYAIVIITGDDVGKSKDGKKSLQPRARQNVVFELGFFLGTLTRKNVCALFMKGVELPSDVSGMVYVELDYNDAWELKLAKEMANAGVKFDMNLLNK